jgi:hypothetical protein
MGSNPPQDPAWGGDPSQGGGYVPPAPTNLPPPAPRPTNLPGGGLTGAGARATVGPQAIPQATGAPTGPVRQLVEPPPPPREGANPWLIAAIAIGTVVLLAGAGGWYFFIRSPNDPVKVETAASGNTTPKGTAAPSGVDRTDDTGPTGTNISGEGGSTIPAPPDVGVPTTTQAPSSGGGGGNSGGGGSSGGGGGGNSGGGGGGNAAPPPTIVTTPPTTAPPAPKIVSFSVSPTAITCKPGDQPGVDMLWSTANTQTVTLVIDGSIQDGFAPNNQPTGFAIDCRTHTAPITIKAIGANNQVVTQTVNVSVLRLIN